MDSINLLSIELITVSAALQFTVCGTSSHTGLYAGVNISFVLALAEILKRVYNVFQIILYYSRRSLFHSSKSMAKTINL